MSSLYIASGVNFTVIQSSPIDQSPKRETVQTTEFSRHKGGSKEGERAAAPVKIMAPSVPPQCNPALLKLPKPNKRLFV